MLNAFKKYKTGLVLSGGAARGFAHLGVLKALDELKIKPGIISGVSAGAIAGAFYADGHKPEDILKILTQKKVFDYFKITIPRKGLFKVSGLLEVLEKNLKAKNIEDLKIPLIITVTNMGKGIPEYIGNGNLAEIIIASSSIPVLFETQKINGSYYADGGIMDNLPVNPVLKKCKRLIGVHVNPVGVLETINGLGQAAERSFHLAIAAEIDKKKDLFDYFIEPAKLKKYGFFDIKKGAEIFEIGYSEAMKMLSKKQ
ncbi:MAG: patatin-like phospholipase family protein [Bacteroidales bacterium]|nr:patatin-like phospholipase family protein [Bacteroidales bacterium]